MLRGRRVGESGVLGFVFFVFFVFLCFCEFKMRVGYTE